MTRTLLPAFLASFVILAQAIPKSAILDESSADVVEILTLKRNEGERKYMIHAFGKRIDLDLQRSNDFLPTNLPVYVHGEDENGNPTMDDWTHRTDSFQSLYTDKKNGASVMIEDVDGETKMTGMVGEDLVVEPITDILISSDKNVFTEKREITRIRHVIYKVKRRDEEANTFDYKVAEESSDEGQSREKRAVPERIYVPVQVVVDYALWKKLGPSESDVIKYIKIFYNTINSMYSSISWPFVSVSLYGIQICKSASACGMVENYKLPIGSVDADASLLAIAKYAYNQKKSLGTDYALMMVMTGYDICSQDSSKTCKKSTSGLAYVGAACAPYMHSETKKVGLSEDEGVYDGLQTVGHEMGHLIGMNHDGDESSMKGGPGAKSCDWNAGYMMGAGKLTLNRFRWTPCSVAQLRWFAVQPRARCLLYKPPTSRYPLINKLPGKEVDLDNQCKVLFGATSSVGCDLPGVNSGNDELCVSLKCNINSNQCSSKMRAAEGSYCGPQRYCRSGKCVCDPTAPLPTAPPKDPSCRSDYPGIELNRMSCSEFLNQKDGLKYCNNNQIKQYCCASRAKYCRATPITCGSPPVTPRPSPPDVVFKPPVITTEKPHVEPTTTNCGKPCADNLRVRIDSKTCGALLASTADKKRLCDNPTVIEHCCATRARVCGPYHWITKSCDMSCQDINMSLINGERCVPFLATEAARENYCTHSITKKNCCATRRKFCTNNSLFGK